MKKANTRTSSNENSPVESRAEEPAEHEAMPANRQVRGTSREPLPVTSRSSVPEVVGRRGSVRLAGTARDQAIHHESTFPTASHADEVAETRVEPASYRHSAPRHSGARHSEDFEQMNHEPEPEPEPKFEPEPRFESKPKPKREGFSLISGEDVSAYSPEVEFTPWHSSKHALVGVIVLVVLVIAGVVGLHVWNNRSVDVMVNESSVSIKVGSSLDDLVSTAGLQLTPGNFMSVGGNVITEGGGDSYEASLNGVSLTQDQIGTTRVSDGQSYEFSNGSDTTEGYEVQLVDVQPKLEVQGTAGAITYVAQWGKVGQKHVNVGTTSGETVDVDVVTEAQDAIIVKHNFNFKDGRKLIALTFDDGPSKYTQQYLDILGQYGAKATFFNLGQSAETYPDLEKACISAGCQVASHTYDHQQLTALSGDDVYSEITKAFASINSASGTSTTIIRPPYGSFTDDTWLLTQGSISASFIWNIDSEDWRLPGSSAIVSNVVSNAYSGAIILMHDGGGNRDEDVEALPQIIQALQNDGYTFVTLDELMAADDSIPSDIASGNATMPSDCVWPTELAA